MATEHLLGLPGAEVMPRRTRGLPVGVSKASVRNVVARAVGAFLAAYSI